MMSKEPDIERGRIVLALEMQSNDAEAKTIGEYLQKLLLKLWVQEEGFSGKRPFGNSGWSFELYEPLVRAGIVKGTIGEDGLQEFDEADASYAICDAICAMASHPITLAGIVASVGM